MLTEIKYIKSILFQLVSKATFSYFHLVYFDVQ